MIRRTFATLTVALGLFLAVPSFADDDPPPQEERGTAFERVTGATREHVPGGRLMVIAYGLVWVFVFGFVARQWRSQQALRDDLARLEKAVEEGRKGP